ncbi:hypothetical protein KZ810_03360 [Sphingomonas sp. RHCKR47]|uniref:hypothetical protein n=1 Tax=Sphingomonas citricola TaxID=2862498 RepID=UPI001CA4C631|nr:hypothetical protein [Sphingomonas citricola]MBW6522525.1 hypothetical protein [Sphingomonas citricola]
MTATNNPAVAPARASIGPAVQAGGRAEWDEALAAYRTAKTNLDTFDARYINTPKELPIGPARSAYVDSIPRSAWAESERLAEIMYDAEERLMPIPAPDAIAFAAKFLVARGEGRTADGYDHLLEAEAARLLREAMA